MTVCGQLFVDTNIRYIKELAERVHVLEYRTGAAPSDPQYNPIAPDQSGLFLPANEFVNRKRPHDSLAGPGFYDTAYNSLSSLQDFTQRPDRAHQDTAVREESGSGALHLTPSSQPQSGDMNATVVHEKEISMYVQKLTF